MKFPALLSLGVVAPVLALQGQGHGTDTASGSKGIFSDAWKSLGFGGSHSSSESGGSIATDVSSKATQASSVSSTSLVAVTQDNGVHKRHLDPNTIHLLVPADNVFAERYRWCVESMKCFSKANSMKFVQLPLENMEELFVDNGILSFARESVRDLTKNESTSFDSAKNSTVDLRGENVAEHPACASRCRLGDSFFRKHCLVSCYLESHQNEANAIAVFDSDVLAGNPKRDLSNWFSAQKIGAGSAIEDLKEEEVEKRNGKSAYRGGPADITMYERCMTFEVAAGNYLARNTPAARAFLMDWSHMEKERPPGFSSSDNGAIHLHLSRAFAKYADDNNPLSEDANTLVHNGDKPGQYRKLNATGYQECERQYHELRASVEDMGPFWNFVSACRNSLGMGPNLPPENDGMQNFRKLDRQGLLLRTAKYKSKTTGYEGPLSVRIYPKSRGWVHDYVS